MKQVLLNHGAGGRDRTGDLLITRPFSSEPDSPRSSVFLDLQIPDAHRNAPKCSLPGKDTGKDKLPCEYWPRVPVSVLEPPPMFAKERGHDWLIGLLDSSNWGGGLPSSKNYFELYDYIDRGEITFSQQSIQEVECPTLPPIRVHGRESKDHRDRKYSAWLWMRGLSEDASAEAKCAYGLADVYSSNLRGSVEVGNCPADRIFGAMTAGFAWLIVWPLWGDVVPVRLTFSEAGTERIRAEWSKYSETLALRMKQVWLDSTRDTESITGDSHV